MFRRSALRLQKTATTALKRAYSSTPEQPGTQSSAHKLAEEVLAQKTGTAKGKATLPKGDKKPAKAKGEKSNMKEIALTAGVIAGLGLGGLFYYGEFDI
jgi:import inner membrane translocase subunit TIM50